MTTRLLTALLLLLVGFGRSSANEKDAQWIVVTPPAYRAALAPLCDQRRADGLKVVIVETTDVLNAKQIKDGDARALRDHVHKLTRQSKGASYVLLVGAVKSAADAEKTVVPPLKGEVNRMKEQPSDFGYAATPEVAVGRFPARSVDDVKEMVKKTLAFEKDRSEGR